MKLRKLYVKHKDLTFYKVWVLNDCSCDVRIDPPYKPCIENEGPIELWLRNNGIKYSVLFDRDGYSSYFIATDTGFDEGNKPTMKKIRFDSQFKKKFNEML